MTRFSRPASGRPAFKGDDDGGGRWETAAGPGPSGAEPMREKPPPEPQQRETLQAAAERRQYFAYLNARLRGEDVKPPPARKMPTAYWPENQPPR